MLPLQSQSCDIYETVVKVEQSCQQDNYPLAEMWTDVNTSYSFSTSKYEDANQSCFQVPQFQSNLVPNSIQNNFLQVPTVESSNPSPATATVPSAALSPLLPLSSSSSSQSMLSSSLPSSLTYQPMTCFSQQSVTPSSSSTSSSSQSCQSNRNSLNSQPAFSTESFQIPYSSTATAASSSSPLLSTSSLSSLSPMLSNCKPLTNTETKTITFVTELAGSGCTVTTKVPNQYTGDVTANNFLQELPQQIDGECRDDLINLINESELTDMLDEMALEIIMQTSWDINAPLSEFHFQFNSIH